MNKALFAVFLIAATAAQTPLPDQTRQLELQKEAMRRAEAQAQAFTILGFPDAESRPAGSHPLAAAQENGQQMTAFSGT